MHRPCRPSSLALVAGLAVLAFAPAAHAGPLNLVVNGSFEADPVVTTFVGTPAGWTNVGTGPFTVARDGTQNLTPLPADGDQAVLFFSSASVTSLAQTVALTAGTTYELSFALAGAPILSEAFPAEMAVSVTGGLDAFNYDFSLGLSQNVWTAESFTFTATFTGDYTLAFTSPAGAMTSLDNVVLTGATTAVPEPATAAMIAGALALGCVALRRRRA